jgi:hypothetical protein
LSAQGYQRRTICLPAPSQGRQNGRSHLQSWKMHAWQELQAIQTKIQYLHTWKQRAENLWQGRQPLIVKVDRYVRHTADQILQECFLTDWGCRLPVFCFCQQPHLSFVPAPKFPLFDCLNLCLVWGCNLQSKHSPVCFANAVTVLFMLLVLR